jgi:hypothetical protein
MRNAADRPAPATRWRTDRRETASGVIALDPSGWGMQETIACAEPDADAQPLRRSVRHREDRLAIDAMATGG